MTGASSSGNPAFEAESAVSCPVCSKPFRTEQGRGGHLRHSKDVPHWAYRAAFLGARPSVADRREPNSAPPFASPPPRTNGSPSSSPSPLVELRRTISTRPEPPALPSTREIPLMTDAPKSWRSGAGWLAQPKESPRPESPTVGEVAKKLLGAIFGPGRANPRPRQRREKAYWDQVLGKGPAERDDD